MDITSLRERVSSADMSVTELNNYIKNMFDSNRLLSSVTVRGEISNFKSHSSGHLYFSLKDADSQIRCVMFRSSAARLKFIPESGMKVIAHGEVSVYTRDGGYQLYVNSLVPDGVGALYLAYEQLKAKLEAEGLFSEEYKKEIPSLPRAVGVITSPTGAAVRDIINVIGRRYPLAKIYLYPSLVQGDAAPDNLIRALDYFDKSGLVDTVIIGRGGGSIEDLWAFNSEAVARRIFAMTIPVISAVGHETDFTICDFVSDMRAPTPSAAAELAVPDIRELIMFLADAEERMKLALLHLAERKREKLTAAREKLLLYGKRFSEFKRNELSELSRELLRNEKNYLKNKSVSLLTLSEKLNALSPLSTLSRGYSLVTHGGSLVNSVSQIKLHDTVEVKFFDGYISAKVMEINEEK